MCYCHAAVGKNYLRTIYDAGADPEIFHGGGGVEKENFEGKMFVDTRVQIKTRQRCNSFSLLPFQEDCLLFFCFVLLPPLDPPM